MDLDLDAMELERYSRHILLDTVGPEGQAALLDSGVLVVGAGGLGSPVIQYLAAAGIGTIAIADDDVVERSNLQRQVIHGSTDIDRPKVESAREYIEELNPGITVETHNLRVTQQNVDSLIDGYDVVVDASDNFPTRFLLNDACTLADIPLSHGAVYRFEGQAMTSSGGCPCYRCLFPEAPSADAIPDCAMAGVLGVLPGTIGAIQATEVLKLILDEGEPLSGRLLVYNARTLSMESVTVSPNPNCQVCGDSAAIDSIAELEYTDDCTILE